MVPFPRIEEDVIKTLPPLDPAHDPVVTPSAEIVPSTIKVAALIAKIPPPLLEEQEPRPKEDGNRKEPNALPPKVAPTPPPRPPCPAPMLCELEGAIPPPLTVKVELGKSRRVPAVIENKRVVLAVMEMVDEDPRARLSEAVIVIFEYANVVVEKSLRANDRYE